MMLTRQPTHFFFESDQTGRPQSGEGTTEVGGLGSDELTRLHRLANLGFLSATTAHEVKNALVAVRTFVDLLLEKHSDAKFADLVRRELLRMEASLTSTLQFARPSMLVEEDFEVHGAVRRALALAGPQLRNRGIVEKTSFDATNSTVRGDVSQFEHAILNLLVNATEAMGQGGTLTVATCEVVEPPEAVPQLIISVSDTGPGIAADHLSQLFQPFFTTKADGTGLGLAITKRIIQQHGGRISAGSTVGKGTKFEIALPVSAPKSGT